MNNENRLPSCVVNRRRGAPCSSSDGATRRALGGRTMRRWQSRTSGELDFDVLSCCMLHVAKSLVTTDVMSLFWYIGDCNHLLVYVSGLDETRTRYASLGCFYKMKHVVLSSGL